MALAEYDAHVQGLGSSFVRSGAVLPREVGFTPYEVAYLSLLETYTRVHYSSTAVGLSDYKNHKAFRGDFLQSLKEELFAEYVGYRKVQQEMSLDEWIENVREEKAAKGEESILSSSEPNDDFIEVSPATFNIHSLISKSTYTEPEYADLPELLSEPTGVDSDGYDVWASNSEGLTTYGVDELGFDLWYDKELEDSTPDFSDLPTYDPQENVDLNTVFVIDSAPLIIVPEDGVIPFDPPIVLDKAPMFRLTKVYGTDDDGFDIWFDPNLIVFEIPNDYITIIGGVSTTHYGMSTDGYDLWYDAENYVTDDPIADTQRDSLGELNTPWLGTAEDGYDVWSAEEKNDQPVEELLSGRVKTKETNPLGEPHSKPYSTDSKGFDIWYLEAVSPVAPPNVLNSRSDSENGFSSPRAFSGVPSLGGVSPAPRMLNQERYVPQDKDTDDKLMGSLISIDDSLKKVGKRFSSWLIK